MRCEDYPACGHGPAPYGDGGGCPDEDGRFECVECGTLMPRGWHSALCSECRYRPRCDGRDCSGCSVCLINDESDEGYWCDRCDTWCKEDQPCPECEVVG